MAVRAWIIPWYRKQDWPRWAVLCQFLGSYEEWLGRAEAGAKRYERLGYNVAKVVVDPEQFIEWSKRSGGKIDHEARIAFATLLFHAQERPGN